MSEKIVARLNILIILFCLLFILIIFITEDNLFLRLFVLFSSIFSIFYNKIELTNGNLTIKSFLFIRAWIIYPIIPQVIINKTVDINNIKKISFAKRDGIIIAAGEFLTPGGIATIYYLSSSGKIENFTITLFCYPEFNSIVEEILKRKPDLKVTFTDTTVI